MSVSATRFTLMGAHNRSIKAMGVVPPLGNGFPVLESIVNCRSFVPMLVLAALILKSVAPCCAIHALCTNASVMRCAPDSTACGNPCCGCRPSHSSGEQPPHEPGGQTSECPFCEVDDGWGLLASVDVRLWELRLAALDFINVNDEGAMRPAGGEVCPRSATRQGRTSPEVGVRLLV